MGAPSAVPGIISSSEAHWNARRRRFSGCHAGALLRPGATRSPASMHSFSAFSP